MTTQTATLDQKLVDALIGATTDIFSTMANTPVSVKSIANQRGSQLSGDLSAVVGIMGSAGEGTISILFPAELANTIVGRLVGLSPDQISSDDRCDGIGELVNMISGNTKTVLSRECDSSYTLSLPSIIIGKGHEVLSKIQNSSYHLIAFEADGQPFFLQVVFKFQ